MKGIFIKYVLWLAHSAKLNELVRLKLINLSVKPARNNLKSTWFCINKLVWINKNIKIARYYNYILSVSKKTGHVNKRI